MGHAERKHSLLGPSGAHRWLACTPSALLERDFPDTTSEAAMEGTLAHELAELKLRNYSRPADFGKRKLASAIGALKKRALWQDEMMRYTDEYLDYVKGACMRFPTSPRIDVERIVPLEAYVPCPPGEEATSGTADCVLVCGNVLHVIDFKYGKSPSGRVGAEGNPQLGLYALGAYETYRLLYPIEIIRMSIVQPRLSDGISEWECPLEELLSFGRHAKGRAELAIKGEGEYAPGPETCKYCRARGRCRARADESVKLAFSGDLGKLPPLISSEEMGGYLTKGATVAKWLAALRDCALKECLAGKGVPGWKAVEGRGSRDWTDADKAFDTLVKSGVAEEAVLWERTPLTLAQVEKTVGKKDFADAVGGYVAWKPGKPALVEASDKRPAITNKVTAEEAFKEEKANE